MLEAGQSGNVSFIPQLLEYRSKARKHSNFQGVAIQLALAELGQPAELRQIRCELLFSSPSVRHDAVDKLVYVGGWLPVAESAFCDSIYNESAAAT